MGFAYGLGYAFGCCATGTAAGLILWITLPAKSQLSAVLVWAISAMSLVPGQLAWGLCGVHRKMRVKVERRWAATGVTAGYLACVGIICGAIVAAALCAVAILPPNAVAFEVVMFGGPFLGVWWILRRKPRQADPDYDDEMTAARQGPENPATMDFPELALTEAFGHRLGTLLFPNAVVALIGPLGAGKTHLVRAIAEGLGIANPAAVTSPTFTLIHEYPARLPIFHFDAYRLKGPDEFLDLGVAEYYEAGGVCLIEWADKVEAALPAERLTIRLTPLDENRRRAEIEATGERYESLGKELIAGQS
jgi:tRNA threonylcarbamoyladenosine biosynthesis protein TsaE